MPRRKTKVLKREIGVDPRFQSQLVQKFINVVMQCGKKNIARAIVYEAFDLITAKLSGDQSKAFALFEKAIGQVKPFVEVKSRRVGGGVYQIPVEVRVNRATTLAFRWVIDAASKRSDKTMGKRLAHELLDAIDGHGNAVKKRTDVHRMAEANRAFSHYAW
ncbi:30S ribosomal protein S7 [Candidatus Babeliales bacterium]|nr:30S ribosomal protein S7 [Candidatus Babeliales bacterium]